MGKIYYMHYICLFLCLVVFVDWPPSPHFLPIEWCTQSLLAMNMFPPACFRSCYVQSFILFPFLPIGHFVKCVFSRFSKVARTRKMCRENNSRAVVFHAPSAQHIIEMLSKQSSFIHFLVDIWWIGFSSLCLVRLGAALRELAWGVQLPDWA